MYNPKSNKLTHWIKIKNEMVTVPDIGNTQTYSDDKSSKTTKITEKMHNFIVNKTVFKQKPPAPGIKYKSKYPREIDGEEGDEFVFSEDEWVYEDNGMETKVVIEGKPLSQEDFKKLEETQKQVEEIDTDQEEKDMVQSFCFCFEG
jgi:hypothetical protein